MCHIFFIHFYVDGHLGCFCVLANVKSATVNTGVHVSFSTRVLSGYLTSSGIASHNTFQQFNRVVGEQYTNVQSKFHESISNFMPTSLFSSSRL